MHRLAGVIPRSPFALLRLVVEVALVVVVAAGLGGVVLGRVLPATGHPVFVVAGPSMTPTIGIGSAVILDAVSPADLRVGDIVSLRSGPQRAVFTHRIVRLAERDGAPWIETQGDANASPDPSITPATAVIGRVGTAIPWAGYLLALLSTPQGVLLVLSVGATLIVLGWFLESLELDRRVRTTARAGTTVVAIQPAGTPQAAPAAPAAVAPIAATVAEPKRRRSRKEPRLTDDVVRSERRRLARTRATGRGAS